MSQVSRYELLCSYEECIKKKRGTCSAINFEVNDSFFLDKLYQSLNTQTYEIGRSITFVLVNDQGIPYREVFAADFCDRVVHHLLINRIIRELEADVFIRDCYACLKNRGVLYGVQRCQEQLKLAIEQSDDLEELYVMKIDFKNFFNSLNKRYVLRVFEKFFDQHPSIDNDFNRWLLKKILFHCPQDKGNYIRLQSKELFKQLHKEKSLFNQDFLHGIAIGNLTSQIFANVLLSVLDHFVKEKLGIQFYGRYVDDAYLIGSKQMLLDAFRQICEFVSELDLDINKNKFYLQHYTHGIKFTGYLVYYDRIYAGRATIGRFQRLVYNWNHMMYTNYYSQNKNIELQRVKKIIQQWNSYTGFLKHTQNRDRVVIDTLERNKYFVQVMQVVCTLDTDFVIRFNKESKTLLNNYYAFETTHTTKRIKQMPWKKVWEEI